MLATRCSLESLSAKTHHTARRLRQVPFTVMSQKELIGVHANIALKNAQAVQAVRKAISA